MNGIRPKWTKPSLLLGTAINTSHVMSDNSNHLVPLLSPRLESQDSFARLFAAANFWRICRSEDAYVILRREAVDEGSPVAEMAVGYLEEADS
jgi:hypothetical protein